MDQPQNSKQIQLHVGDDERKTKAANFVIVNSNPLEFVLDFFHVFSPEQMAKLQARISLPPLIAKGLLQALQQNLGSYEAKNGPIREPSEKLPQIGFQPQRS